ncbi:ATP-dependent Clp protease proteolytic subunit [Pseudonocardia petroleophila]|uniref:ATP-dependent Clp protease proteolytic subunit n=1 Tax=Pseudonocardia petroleophila TaxID=37331 RepID=A0A7G7MPX5_9PSEU|nr:ATP-dependent Clp protease proteolytic subunit [Pseudonocardia petroleophila]QNG54836.1 ATP-dependent Clp protease proteolytic subunit [Pseudonocardia petroleophila]
MPEPHRPTVVPLPPPQPPQPSFTSTLLVAGADPVAEHLLDVRIVHVGGVLDADAADRVCARLRLLAARDPRAEITLTVSCTAGTAGAGLAVVDTMALVGPEVATCAVGAVAGVGQLVVTAGAPGRRTAARHARLALRTPAADPAPATVSGAQRREAVAVTAARSGRDAAEVAADTAAERWFTAAEAVAYGLVDAVV